MIERVLIGVGLDFDQLVCIRDPIDGRVICHLIVRTDSWVAQTGDKADILQVIQRPIRFCPALDHKAGRAQFCGCRPGDANCIVEGDDIKRYQTHIGGYVGMRWEGWVAHQ